MTKIWTLKQKDIRRLKTAEMMKFIRRTAGYSLLDHRRLLEEFKVDGAERSYHS